MISLTILNIISFGLMLWLYEFITIPITNLITIGLMQNILYGFPLILIASALSANAAFRDGHKYQGGFGYINSWFAGLYLLCVMLTFGLLIAIIVHATYNIIIHLIHYGNDVIRGG
jgi:hypothetical protein